MLYIKCRFWTSFSRLVTSTPPRWSYPLISPLTGCAERSVDWKPLRSIVRHVCSPKKSAISLLTYTGHVLTKLPANSRKSSWKIKYNNVGKHSIYPSHLFSNPYLHTCIYSTFLFILCRSFLFSPHHRISLSRAVDCSFFHVNILLGCFLVIFSLSIRLPFFRLIHVYPFQYLSLSSLLIPYHSLFFPSLIALSSSLSPLSLFHPLQTFSSPINL